MKWLLLAGVLLCLFGVMACENEVTGDFPIVQVGDTVTVFVQPDDWYRVALYPGGCNVEIERTIDDNITVDFYEHFDYINIANIVNIPGPGDDDT